MVGKIFKRIFVLLIITLFSFVIFSISSYAVNDNARYLMDAVTMSNNNIAVLFVKGGTSSGNKTSGGILYLSIYNPANNNWEESIVGEIAAEAKEATLAVHDDKAHVAYITTDNKLAYTYQTSTGWSDLVLINSLNANGSDVKNDELSCPDIAVDSNGKAHIAYVDTDGAGDGDYHKPDGMYATNASGNFIISVIANCTGWRDAGVDYDTLINPIKIDYADNDRLISYKIHNYSTDGWGGRYNNYTLYFNSSEGTSSYDMDTNSSGKIYEVCRDGTHYYTFMTRLGNLVVYDGNNTVVDGTEKAVSVTNADMTLNGSNIYYAGITNQYEETNGTFLLFYQNGTFIEGKTATTDISSHNNFVTVVSNDTQYVLYTGSDEDTSLVISKLNNDEITEFLVPNEIIEYTVTFDSNGGTGTIDTVTQREGTTYSLPECTITPPVGYTFKDWLVNQVGESDGTYYNPGANISMTQNYLIRPRWSAITYNITYNLNGGNPVANPEEYSVESDNIVLINPTKENYEFNGWTGTDCIEPTMTVTIPKGSTGDRSYVATWKKIISIINISGIEKPVIGEHPSVSNIATDTEGITLGVVQWQRLSNSAVIDSNAIFEANTAYGLYITFDVNDGYVISDTATILANEAYEELDNRFPSFIYMKYSTPEVPIGSINVPTITQHIGYTYAPYYNISVRITNNVVVNGDNLIFEITGDNASSFKTILSVSDLNGPGLWNSADNFAIATQNNLPVGTYTATITLKYDSDDNGTYETIIGSGEVSCTISDHNWGEPSYVWSDDNSKVTAKRVCTINESDIETETVDTTNEITKLPSFDEFGERTYTATFENPAFSVQNRKVNIEKLDFNNIMPDSITITELDVEQYREGYNECIYYNELDDGSITYLVSKKIKALTGYDVSAQLNIGKVEEFPYGIRKIWIFTGESGLENSSNKKLIDISYSVTTDDADVAAVNELINGKIFTVCKYGSYPNWDSAINYYYNLIDTEINDISYDLVFDSRAGDAYDLKDGSEEGIVWIYRHGILYNATTYKFELHYKVFPDVENEMWYTENIIYVKSKGIMSGYNNGDFGLNDTISRGQIVTILYRLAGNPSTKGLTNPFEDVPEGQYYSEAIKWAFSKGITTGKTEKIFDPLGNATRQELAVFLTRYAEKIMNKNVKSTYNISNIAGYSDISNWAISPMKYIMEKGVITGDMKLGYPRILPCNNATRAEAATMITRFCKNVLDM